jgi:fumarate hydratase class II
VVKIGRTHLEDAVPLTVGQEWSGWAAQLDAEATRTEASKRELYRLAGCGTAVGTGLNAPHPSTAPPAARTTAQRVAFPLLAYAFAVIMVGTTRHPHFLGVNSSNHRELCPPTPNCGHS